MRPHLEERRECRVYLRIGRLRLGEFGLGVSLVPDPLLPGRFITRKNLSHAFSIAWDYSKESITSA